MSPNLPSYQKFPDPNDGADFFRNQALSALIGSLSLCAVPTTRAFHSALDPTGKITSQITINVGPGYYQPRRHSSFHAHLAMFSPAEPASQGIN